MTDIELSLLRDRDWLISKWLYVTNGIYLIAFLIWSIGALSGWW